MVIMSETQPSQQSVFERACALGEYYEARMDEISAVIWSAEQLQREAEERLMESYELFRRSSAKERASCAPRE